MKIIVVGGGVVGMSAAYHMARKGADVTLVDYGHEGRATSAGAGIVFPWVTQSVHNLDWFRLAGESARYYSVLKHKLNEDGEENWGYKKVGALSISNQKSELDAIEKMVRRSKETFSDVGEITRLSNKEAKQLYPLLGEQFEAIHTTGAYRVNGRLLRKSLKNAATKHKVTFIKGKAKIAEEDRKVIGVRVDHELYEADAVFVAAGAWAPELLKPLGIQLPVKPQRGQIIHLKLPGVNTSNWPVVQARNNHYLLSFDDSRVVVGATREDDAGFDYRLTAGGVQEVLNEALLVAPELADSTIHEMRIGFRQVVPDGTPLIGDIEGIKGLTLVNGLGAGLTMGPFIGKLMADYIIDQDVSIDLSPYNPLRFQANES